MNQSAVLYTAFIGLLTLLGTVVLIGAEKNKGTLQLYHFMTMIYPGVIVITYVTIMETVVLTSMHCKFQFLIYCALIRLNGSHIKRVPTI